MLKKAYKTITKWSKFSGISNQKKLEAYKFHFTAIDAK